MPLTKPTIAEAKYRFKSYTRSVLTNEARRDVRETGQWEMIDGWPCLISANYVLKFRKDLETGNVSCESV